MITVGPFPLKIFYFTDRKQRKVICLRLLCATSRKQIWISELYSRQFLIVYFTTPFWTLRKVPLLPPQHVIWYIACMSIPHLAPSLLFSRDSSTLLTTFILFQPQEEKFQSGIWTAVRHMWGKALLSSASPACLSFFFFLMRKIEN